jgi:hypothetical protein
MRTFAGVDFPRPGVSVRQVFGVACCIALVQLAGCGPGGPPAEPREQVSGTVSFDGNPLPFGNIEFRNESTKVFSSSLPIKNGVYNSSSGEGPAAGMNVVYISGSQEEGGMPMWTGLYKTNIEIKKGKNDGTDISIDKKAVKPFDPKKWSEDPNDRL